MVASKKSYMKCRGAELRACEKTDLGAWRRCKIGFQIIGSPDLAVPNKPFDNRPGKTYKFINRREIVSTESVPLSLILPPILAERAG